MSQSEILDILKKCSEPIPAREIIKNTDVNEKHVFVLLKILITNKEVNVIEIPRDVAFKKYGLKRRIRLYYVD